MLRHFSFILISLSLAACATSSHPSMKTMWFSVSDLQAPNRDVSAKPSGNEKSYISMDLPVRVFEKLRVELEASQNLKLKSRGEAHITLVTPQEFKKLSKKVPASALHTLADEMDLQKSPYKLLCVGKGSVKTESTFYVVIESDRLFQIRKALQALYVKKGGAATDFLPEEFYPHVTVGFTQRDLHIEEGVVKDASSCIYSLRSEQTK